MEITRRKANNIASVKEIGLSEFCVDTTANFSLHIPLDRIKEMQKVLLMNAWRSTNRNIRM